MKIQKQNGVCASSQLVTLNADGWEIDISHNHGAAILKCRYKNRDIFRPVPAGWLENPNLLTSGCFPLVPYSNRIGNGHFTFGGKDYQIRPNHPVDCHPIHGLGWLSAWDIEQKSATSAKFSFRHAAKECVWPWSFETSLILNVDERTFHMSLTLENQSFDDMPAGLGFHPYFANCESLWFRSSATHIQKNGSDNLPIKDGIKPLDVSLKTKKMASGFIVDNCFFGGDGDAVVGWDGYDTELQISVDDTLPFTVIYSNPDNGDFCLEPVSHLNDAFNIAPAGMETGLKIMRPNETMTANMSLKMETKNDL
jgi:aldose 1-epimerase